ncbi:MAG: acyl-CoA thioesterase domain-containing protein [Solirubrobacteraceae bacterium]
MTYLDPEWTFSGRAFGGYSAAALVRAAAAASPHPELLSVNVTFLRALVPGRFEVEIDEVRSGRTAWISRASVVQDGAVALIGDVWMAPAKTLAPVAAASDPGDAAIAMDSFTDEYPFMRYFEEVGVSYPASVAESSADAPAAIDVWLRPRHAPSPDSPLERQLVQLMLVDAHIIDAAVRPHGMASMIGLSHNLTVHWTAMPSTAGWFRLRADAVGDAAYSATRATVEGAGGAPCAWALQHGRVVPDSPLSR